MTRCLVTKRIARLLWIAVLLYLFGAVPDELRGRFELPQSTARRSHGSSTIGPTLDGQSEIVPCQRTNDGGRSW